MGFLTVRDAQVWPEGRSGNYGTAKYFLDESQNEAIPIDVSVQVYADGNAPGSLDVELFSNINRRDYAKVWESPDQSGGPTSYYMSYPLRYEAQSGDNFVYRTNLTLTKTGAYRLTARFRINHGPWLWHNKFRYGVNQRDCAIVVSPKKALGLTLYEVNPLVATARPGGAFEQRGTLDDFTDTPPVGQTPFNLAYVRNTLGFNTLWIMPIFPITRELWDPNQRKEVANYSPGSPYATRDYWSVNEFLSRSNTPPASLAAFKRVVAEADRMGLNVFIDVALNHAGADVIYGQGAVDLDLAASSQAGLRIRSARPAWCTKNTDYQLHADNPDDTVLYAPSDRRGEHCWYDAGLEWFFGNYSALGPKPDYGDTRQGGALDEQDLFYTDLDPQDGHDYEVESVWNYFAYLLPYWLDLTSNRLAGIRADFAQGLPPQAWEYIINKTRQKKWDFVFLAEALDPDPIRYRVNRHFDVLTTVHHALYRDSGVTMSQFVGSLDNECSLYGYNAAVLHNGTSHDEVGNNNTWLMLARYAVAASSYGVPMIYMTQPLGVSDKIDFKTSWQNLQHNWDGALPHVAALYQRLNQARENQPALRSLQRYFLSRQHGAGFNENIYSCARWAGDNVLLVFVNLRDYIVGPETFAIPEALPLGNSPDLSYQVCNLMADDPGQTLWPQPRTTSDIRKNGVYVEFHFPNEIQFLLLKRQ